MPERKPVASTDRGTTRGRQASTGLSGLVAPVLRVVGDLTAATAGGLSAAGAALAGEPALIIDLSAVTGGDGPALRNLIGTLRRLRRSGRTLAVVPPRGPELARALSECRAARTAASLDEARALLAG